MCAFEADHGAGQFLRGQAAGAQAGHAAVIEAEIGLMLGQIMPTEVILPLPAALAAEVALAIKAAHGVAAADGQMVLRHQG